MVKNIILPSLMSHEETLSLGTIMFFGARVLSCFWSIIECFLESHLTTSHEEQIIVQSSPICSLYVKLHVLLHVVVFVFVSVWLNISISITLTAKNCKEANFSVSFELLAAALINVVPHSSHVPHSTQLFLFCSTDFFDMSVGFQ